MATMMNWMRNQAGSRGWIRVLFRASGLAR